MSYIWQQNFTIENLDLFCLSPPPPYVMRPPVTDHVSVNQYVKLYMMRASGGANIMHPLNLGGGGATNGKNPKLFYYASTRCRSITVICAELNVA